MTKKEIIKYVKDKAEEYYQELLNIEKQYGRDSIEASRAAEKWWIIEQTYLTINT